MAELLESSVIALSSVCGFFGLLLFCAVALYCRRHTESQRETIVEGLSELLKMGASTSRNGQPSNRRNLYEKRTKANGIRVTRAVPSAYIPPPDPEILPSGVTVISGFRDDSVSKPRENETQPKTTREPEPQQKTDGKNETQSNTSKLNDSKTDQSKTNGYVKNSKNKKVNNEHIIQKERSYKLYDPEHVIYRERGRRLYDEVSEVRPKSFIHYERVKPGYVARERGYKMHEPRYNARRVAYTYGTLRHQPEINRGRPVEEILTARPISEVKTVRQRPVRVIKSVPPLPIRSVRPHTIGRPIIVRRSVEPEEFYSPATERIVSSPGTERVYATPVHGYIPRHRLGTYKPKVIEGFVAPTSVRADHTFSDPGGYREKVILEQIYQTGTIPPPPYPGVRVHERDKIPGHKMETVVVEKVKKRQSGSFGAKLKVPQTDDEKLKDVPLTQFFDDGKTIMIIDYLMDPLYTKINRIPHTSSTPRHEKINGDLSQDNKQNGHVSDETKQNGHVSDETKQNGDVHNDYEELNNSFSSDPYRRQRPEQFGDVDFLP